MLDTIVLRIEDGDFLIEDHNKFSPSTKPLFEKPYYPLGPKNVISCGSIPVKDNEYYPTVTVVKRYYSHFKEYRINLYIQFSAPKVIFGNNVDEVKEEDFNEVCASLFVKLQHMGIILYSIDSLANAKVTRAHFSKNIVFTDYTTASMVINYVKKADMTQRLDLMDVKYKNGGSAIYFHSTAYEFVLYDKIKEMQVLSKSPKRSVELDKFEGNVQEELFKKPCEILRMEARINETWKLRSLFKELDIQYDRTFYNMFHPEVPQKILRYYWRKITGGLLFLALAPFHQ